MYEPLIAWGYSRCKTSLRYSMFKTCPLRFVQRISICSYLLQRREENPILLTGKINKIRTFALLLIFIGVGIMYLGFVWSHLMLLFFILGMLATFASVGIYFWIGILSTHAVKVICPECQKETKVLGKKDQCMYCKAILSVDPKDAPGTPKS